jgi:hypothetical protein
MRPLKEPHEAGDADPPRAVQQQRSDDERGLPSSAHRLAFNGKTTRKALSQTIFNKGRPIPAAGPRYLSRP